MNVYTMMLLDDHHVAQHGLMAIIRKIPSILATGHFTRSRDVLEAMRVRVPDILVLDFELHPDDVDGFALTRIIRRQYPDVKILTLTAHATPSVMALAFRAGSNGFCSKGSDEREIATAIAAILEGRKYVPASVAKPHVYDISRASIQKIDDQYAEPNLIPTLCSVTEREREVVQLFLMGMSISEISRKLSRSRKTISGHKQSAYRKLGVASDADLFKLKNMLK